MNCYLSLGANLGDRKRSIRQAIELISQIDGVELLAVSHFYETEPWGVEDQPDFINAAVKIESTLEPLQLLDALQEIERNLGRVRSIRWGARDIDIDILTIGDMIIDEERLQVPHLFMFDRDFVMVPLSEIYDMSFELYGNRVVKTDGCLVDCNLALIACIDNNFGLGFNGQLLFNFKEDLERFRDLTLNNTVIMGRKTFEAIGKPLDNRFNIVLSKTLKHINGVEIVSSLEELYIMLDSLRRSSHNVTQGRNFIIGGGEIYNQLLPYISEIYLTAVNEEKTADTFLNDFEECGSFICDSFEDHDDFEFRHYCRSSNIIGGDNCGNF